MPTAESNEPMMFVGGLVAFFGFFVPWFSAPGRYDRSRDWGQTDLSNGWRWTIPICLLLVVIASLWARSVSQATRAAGWAMFVVLLGFLTVGLTGARAVTKAEYLDSVTFLGAAPILIGLALIVVGAIRALAHAQHEHQVESVTRDLELHRQQIRELEKTVEAARVKAYMPTPK
jgi:hypothetical protein